MHIRSQYERDSPGVESALMRSGCDVDLEGSRSLAMLEIGWGVESDSDEPRVGIA